MDTKTKKTREQWLDRAVVQFRKRFERAGVKVPAVRVSCGWPGGGSPHKRIGECWPTGRSAEKINQIFISPVLAQGGVVLDVLGHELLHAVDDCRSGHGREFTRNSKAVGYSGGKHSKAQGETAAWISGTLLPKLGAYPHGTVTPVQRGRKGAQHGLHKCVCGSCEGVTFYATQKTLETIGAPVCPLCGEETQPVERGEKKLKETI